MQYDSSIEREALEDRQLSDWLRANPGRERPTMTVSEFGELVSGIGHSDHTAHAWRQVCELVRSDGEDMTVIRSDDSRLKGILVVKENNNG